MIKTYIHSDQTIEIFSVYQWMSSINFCSTENEIVKQSLFRTGGR